jgi:NitT/TauT family transport system substrate-binding protein
MSGSAAHVVNAATPSRVVFSLPYWVAEQRGFFKDEGLECTLEIINNAEDLKQRLKTGSLQVAIDSPNGVIVDAEQGGPLRVIAGNANKPPLFVIAQPHITSIEKIRGATIGVLSLNEGSSKIIASIAARHGLKPADYKIVAVGGAPTRAVLLREGKIDVGLQPFPLNYEAEAEGFNNLAWAGTYEPEWQFTTINANRDWAARQPQRVVAFLRAMLRGQRFIASNAGEAAHIAANEMNTSVTFSARAIEDCARLGILDSQLAWSDNGLARVFQLLQADGAIGSDRTFNLSRFSEHTYLQHARNSLVR